MQRRSMIFSLLAGSLLAPGLVSIQAAPSTAMRYDGTPITNWDTFWNGLSFGSLPAFNTAGSVNLSELSPAAVNFVMSKLGYDPTKTFTIIPGQLPITIPISWNAGDLVSQAIPLGVVNDFFATGISSLSFNNIASLAGQSLGGLNLASFSLSNWQSIANLSDAIPSLAGTLLSDLETAAKPIFDLITGIPNLANQVFAGGFATLGDAVAGVTGLGTTFLSQLTNLTSYPLTAINGLVDTALEKFRGWTQSLVAQVPFLQNIPFGALGGISGFLSFGNLLGKIDLILGTKEEFQGQVASTEAGFDKNTISGGARSGWRQRCQERSCPHIEFTGPGGLKGKRVAAGSVQKVEGGRGILKPVNGGKEPTGYEPFKFDGGIFKLAFVHSNQDEATDSIQIALFFCIRITIPFTNNPHETPKFIGPIPLFTVGVNQLIPLPGFAADVLT
ncbi:hypothetical protein [Anthocerotibacter panamensis]|uniref:hypothetical protein n=1 Tax=Anthocerotibacter panamensis TaxID=2857077 RepID=UPI001C405319|nr:hypothetical protein [Anthocerotibacter panamensis]